MTNNKGQLLAYVRVSTVEQNEDRQIKAIEERFNIDKWYTEKVSAKDINRKELQRMIDYAREGDTVVIKDFSRLARSTKDLLNIVETLNSKGVQLISLKENIDSSTSTGKLMLTMISAIYEFERANMLERQKEGIEIAKQKGKYKGRQKRKIDKHFIELYERYLRREINITDMAEILNTSRSVIYSMIKRYKEQEAKKQEA